jgi:hypothetical protein
MRVPGVEARTLAALITGRETVVRLDSALAAAAVEHGVAPIVYRTLTERDDWEHAAGAARSVLGRAAREAVIVEPIRHAHMERTVAALADRGVTPLLFKGAVLAHSHYPEPWLRVRGDTDLLVRREEVAIVDAVLSGLGLARLPRPNGSRVTQQARYTMRWQSIEIAYDVHWRIADPHVFADASPYDVLERGSLAGPVAGARRIGDVHALLAACVHRAAHHFDTDRLLLLYDIALLARGLTDAEWQDFCREARGRRLRAVCGRALGLAAQLFDLNVPERVGAALETRDDEASAAFVTTPMTRFRLLRSDLRALPSWRERIALLYEHAFPSVQYLRQADDRSGAIAPLMYVERLVRGLNAWRHPL